MTDFRELVEDAVLNEDGSELQELILDYYEAECDEELVSEDEDGNEIAVFDVGLEIISDLAYMFTMEQVDLIKEKLQEMSGLTDEDLDEMSMYEDEDLEEDQFDERKKFRIIKKKDKIRLAKKKRAIGKLGKDKSGANKAASAEFRAKKKFDPKKKRFVFRKKKRSISQQKRMDRKFTRRLKRRRRN